MSQLVGKGPADAWEVVKAEKPAKVATRIKRTRRIRLVNPKTAGDLFPNRRDEAYREHVRGLPCALAVVPGSLCEGVVEAAHVVGRSTGAFDAGDLVPLCRKHHRWQHRIGALEVFKRTFVNLAEDAIRIFHHVLEDRMAA